MSRNRAFNPEEMMLTKSGAQSYLTGMLDEDFTYMDHIRDYLRFSLSVVTDADGEFLVWVKSKYGVEERIYFDQYAGVKIILTKGGVTPQNVHIYRRLVYTWNDRMRPDATPPRRLHEHAFVHDSRQTRRETTNRNRTARQKAKDSQRPEWWMGGDFEAAQLTGVPRARPAPSGAEADPVDVEDGDLLLHQSLKEWNDLLRTDKNTSVPQSMEMFTLDMDHIVSKRHTHLIVRLLIDVYARGAFDIMKTFIAKIVSRTDYRNVYNTVQHLIPITIKSYINRERGVMLFTRSNNAAS